MVVDPGTGDVYAVDGGNNRVEQFDSSGNFLSAWGWGVTDGAAQLETCTASCQAGSPGDGDGQFNTPGGDAIDPATGEVYVVDGYGDDRVEVFGIGQASSTGTTLSSSANPSVSGQQVTYTATVTPVPDQGTVAFSDDGQAIAACTAQPVSTTNGTATCTVSYPAPSTHQIVATFSTGTGSANSTSPALTQTVNMDAAAVQTSAQGTFKKEKCHELIRRTGYSICIQNYAVTFTATVTAAPPGTGTPTGSVQFTALEPLVSRGAGQLKPLDATVPLSGGSATTQTPITLPPGIFQVTAAYSGDTNFSPSTVTPPVAVPNLTVACANLIHAPTGDNPPTITDPATVLAQDQQKLATLIAEGQGNSDKANALRQRINLLQLALQVGCTSVS